MDDIEKPEKPPSDASLSEIWEWMDAHWSWSLATALDDDEEDEHDVIEVEIVNHQQGEVVGTIDTNGNLDTESEALRNVSQEYLEEGVPVLVPMTYENEEGETVHADGEVIVEPGATGFVRAFVDELPSPFDCDPEALANLPVHDVERG